MSLSAAGRTAAEGMNKIILFRKDERRIISTIKEKLVTSADIESIESINVNLNALEELAGSISKYPSILGTQQLGGSSRSIETLVETLCVKDIMDLMLHIPTKALLGKGFAVAKVNFLLMLLYLARENRSLLDNENEILEIITRNIYGIMAEDVYLSIISEKGISLHIRTNAGYNLANLWEHRIDCGVREFAPILGNLWSARKKLKPAFGTLLGLSELFMLTGESGDGLLADFFNQDEINEGILFALQEFLMGLSYEEMTHLMYEMEKTKKSSLSLNEIEEILGEDMTHPRYNYSDPREIYRSYMLRKKNSEFRSVSGLPGPKKTFEDHLMCYLLARPSEWTD